MFSTLQDGKFTISSQCSGKLRNSISGNLAKENQKDVHKHLTTRIHTECPCIIMKNWKGSNAQNIIGLK